MTDKSKDIKQILTNEYFNYSSLEGINHLISTKGVNHLKFTNNRFGNDWLYTHYSNAEIDEMKKGQHIDDIDEKVNKEID